MSVSSKLIAAALGLVVVAGAASGAGNDDKAIKNAIKTRQAQMQLYAYNIGILGAMAKGEAEYDAEAAQTAADNLAAVNGLKLGGVWIPGSDNASVEGTRALPAIWAPGSDVGAKAGALKEALAGLQASAGGGLDALRASIGPVGKACGSCHEDYRKPE